MIFQFKTGVKLKWDVWNPWYRVIFIGWEIPLENRSVIFSAARKKPSKIGQKFFRWPRNFRRFL
jgi:hypothetical protein